MQFVSKQQIYCVFDTDDSTPIFDKDEWENGNNSVQSNKEIQMSQNHHADQKNILKIKQEIEKSKQNFFKVNVVKKAIESTSNSKQNIPQKQNIHQKGKQESLAKKQAILQNDKPQGLITKNQKLPSLSRTNKNAILIQGYLNKKTDGFFFKWHKRFLVLTCQKLYFFSCDKKYELIGCVNLKLLPAKIKENQNEIILDFLGQCENIILKTQVQENRKMWMKWLKQVIDFQSKENKVMIKTMVKPIYDSKDTIAEKHFIQAAETGDILLFHTKNTGAQIQRLITNSDFDHVAMIVKFRKNQLMVFESNQMYGVSIFDWRQYITYFDLYQKISMRKLEYIKKADVQRQLLNFVKKNLGKNYEINMSKLVTLQSDVNWDTINKQKNKSRGYFCSQLIAKALKSVGLLDEKKSSGRYWPVDFAEKSGMLLKKGAYLGKQQVIILNKHLKNYI